MAKKIAIRSTARKCGGGIVITTKVSNGGVTRTTTKHIHVK